MCVCACQHGSSLITNSAVGWRSGPEPGQGKVFEQQDSDEDTALYTRRTLTLRFTGFMFKVQQVLCCWISRCWEEGLQMSGEDYRGLWRVTLPRTASEERND